MDININNEILAVVTLKGNAVKVAGGAPIFLVEDEKELKEITMLLARITLGMVHDLKNGVYILVRH